METTIMGYIGIIDASSKNGSWQEDAPLFKHYQPCM